MSDRYQAPSFYTGGKTVAIGETDIWNEVFAEEIDWRNGWKSYWDYAADNFSDGTDYDSQVPKVELQIFHESGHKSNVATALPPNYKPISMQAMAIASMVLNACEQHGPAVAFVADTVCSSSTPNARPTVTILCESPFGGLETAQQLHGMLMSELKDVSVTCRGIKNNRAGVVKAAFHPELYETFNTSCLNIDWNAWWNLVDEGDNTAYFTASLMWEDWAAGTVLAMKRDNPMFINAIYFDYCQTVAFNDPESVEQALSNPEIIKYKQMDTIPARTGLMGR